MFSLIVSIIAVVLTVGIAVATVYYGGVNINTSGSRATAEQLVNAGEHLTSAGAIYQNDHAGNLPDVPTQLAPDYLSSIPLPPATVYAKGLAAPSTADWAYLPGTANIILQKLSKDACNAVNALYGIPSIPPSLDTKYLIQCYGTYEPYTFYFDPPGGNPIKAAQVAASMPPVQPAKTIGIVATNGTRTFADSTVPTSCNGYRTPALGYGYTGATGDGTYEVNIQGANQNVYCDMSTDGGGWTLVANAAAQNSTSSWATSSNLNLSSLMPGNATSAHLNDSAINALKSVAFRVVPKDSHFNKRFFKPSCDFSWSNGTKITGDCLISYSDMSWATSSEKVGKGCASTGRGLCDGDNDYMNVIVADTRSYGWFIGVPTWQNGYLSGDEVYNGLGVYFGINADPSFTLWVK